MEFDILFQESPYSLDKSSKEKLLTEGLVALTRKHYISSPHYKNMMDAINLDLSKVNTFYDLPYLPVSLFKELELRSVPKEEIVKTMTSSGTSGQQVSKIYLDRETSSLQTKVLTKIVSDFIGKRRVPMLIIDSPSVVKDKTMFSARGAGILGFSMFGSKCTYALDENMQLDIEGLKSFLESNKGDTILLFGFTFMIWQHFYKKLISIGFKPDLSNAVLIHGGGWKKLLSESVSPTEFKKCLNDVCGISIDHVHDYYGMVEQTGTIYMECKYGHLHASNFSDVIIRRPKDFSVADFGEKGIMEVVSLLPQSYPGHILLTEDEGVILGEDDCPCGRKGKYFKIFGRIQNAEIRGCSDTYAATSGNMGELKYIVGNDSIVSDMPNIKPMSPFSDEAITFLNDLSKILMRIGREYSDVATFGFWCRRSALLKEKEKYDDLSHRLGRGIVFHSTPSNVPVNFAFSFAAGLLAGNANIVRLPAKGFPQVTIICNAINDLLNDSHRNLIPYICMVKYPPIIEITDKFSSICDSRVIWGGDATIEELRKSPLRSRANEVTFADRYSIAIINADEYIKCTNKGKVVQDFYNDTYFSDQNACTSPRMIIWIGDEKTKAKKEFWSDVSILVRKNYSIASVQCVGKLTALYKAASQLKIKDVQIEAPVITRIAVDQLNEDIMEYKYNSGFFFEYDAKTLSELLPVCTNKCQTLTYYGISKDELEKFFCECKPQGVDRAVPMGKSMDFALVWDGYDLIRTLSRKVSIM